MSQNNLLKEANKKAKKINKKPSRFYIFALSAVGGALIYFLIYFLIERIL